MSDTHSILEQFHHPVELDADFENGVFAKIRHVKRRRRLTAAIAAPLAVVALIAALHLFRAQSSAPVYTAAVHPVATEAKEEVPLSADLFFAASDSRTQYSVERVLYTPQSAQSNSQQIRHAL